MTTSNVKSEWVIDAPPKSGSRLTGNNTKSSKGTGTVTGGKQQTIDALVVGDTWRAVLRLSIGSSML